MLYLIFVGSFAALPSTSRLWKTSRLQRNTLKRRDDAKLASCGRDNGFGQAAEAMNTDYNDEPRPEDQSTL